MAYSCLLGHSSPMDAAQVGSNHSKFSVSINHELMNIIIITRLVIYYSQSITITFENIQSITITF